MVASWASGPVVGDMGHYWLKDETCRRSLPPHQVVLDLRDGFHGQVGVSDPLLPAREIPEASVVVFTRATGDRVSQFTVFWMTNNQLAGAKLDHETRLCEVATQDDKTFLSTVSVDGGWFVETRHGRRPLLRCVR